MSTSFASMSACLFALVLAGCPVDKAPVDTGTCSPCDTDTGNGSDTDTGTDTDTGSGNGNAEFAVGDVLVNEFMANSHPVADETGEWIELVNLTDHDLDLIGLTLGDLDPTLPQAVTIETHVLLPAGGFVVLGNNDALAANGGVEVAWVWAAADFQLGNDGDEIVLTKGADTYDSVAYDETDWGMVKGVSVQRDARRQDVGSSSDASAWCAGTTTFGTDAQLGTPNALNDSCVR